MRKAQAVRVRQVPRLYPDQTMLYLTDYAHTPRVPVRWQVVSVVAALVIGAYVGGVVLPR